MQLLATDENCQGINQLLVVQEQGDNTPIEIIFGGVDDPTDITGWIFEGTINFPTPILLSIGNGIIVVDATTGRINLQLSSEQTQDVPPGQYSFDLWSITDGVSPVNSDPLTGFFEINLALTRIS